MLRQVCIVAGFTAFLVLATPANAHAWGAAHVGYTHVGPGGVYHAGATGYRGGYGGGYGGAHYGAYRGGYGGAYHSYGYGGAAAGGYRYGSYGGYSAYRGGVYRGW